MLAEWEKGSTFAPAFGRNGGREKRGAGSEFFESLRPAQDQAPPGGGARERNLLGRNTKENIKAEPEIQKKNLEYNNTTTKSLILAQDER